MAKTKAAARKAVLQHISIGKEDERAYKGEFDGLTVKQLASAYKRIQTQLKAADDKKKALQKKFDYLRNHALPTAMESTGATSTKLKGIGRVGLYPEMYASVVKGQKESAHDWLRENDAGDLIQDSVNSSTLKAYIKEQVPKGAIFPNDIFAITPFIQARVTKT